VLGHGGGVAAQVQFVAVEALVRRGQTLRLAEASIGTRSAASPESAICARRSQRPAHAGDVTHPSRV